MENNNVEQKKRIYYSCEELAMKLINDTLSILGDKKQVKSIEDAVEYLYTLYQKICVMPDYYTEEINDYICKKITESNIQTQAYLILIRNFRRKTYFHDDGVLTFHSQHKNCTLLLDLLKNYEAKIYSSDIEAGSYNLALLMIKYYKYLSNLHKNDNDAIKNYRLKIIKYTILVYPEDAFELFDSIPKETTTILDICNSLDEVPKDKEKIINMEKEIAGMKKKIYDLEIELKYRPDGEGLKECEASFYSTADMVKTTK